MPIAKDEIVAIKAGHIVDRATLRQIEDEIEVSYIQIDEDFFIGALTKEEVAGNKLYLNHSCDPNVGIRGQVTFVAMRDVDPGEELTYDWAMEESSDDRMNCRCGSGRCRGVVTGQDWRNPELQRKYRGYLSSYIQGKIDNTGNGL